MNKFDGTAHNCLRAVLSTCLIYGFSTINFCSYVLLTSLNLLSLGIASSKLVLCARLLAALSKKRVFAIHFSCPLSQGGRDSFAVGRGMVAVSPSATDYLFDANISASVISKNIDNKRIQDNRPKEKQNLITVLLPFHSSVARELSFSLTPFLLLPKET